MKIGRIAFPLLLILLLGTLGCSKGDTGPTGPAGPAGPSQMIGFASIDAINDAVYNFGGTKTTGVTVVHELDGSSNPIPGSFRVTFTGTYTGVTDVTDITVLASISGAYDDDQIVLATMTLPPASAGATTIVVPVYVEYGATASLVDADFSVVVLSSK